LLNKKKISLSPFKPTIYSTVKSQLLQVNTKSSFPWNLTIETAIHPYF